ncbi:MAG: aminotransferase class V-fold PLP-dependent enzyme [Pseudomonadota bacterium]
MTTPATTLTTIDLPQPGRDMRALYDLEPGMRFLNHGSYGAVATPIKAVQDDWRRRIEQNPDGFFRDQWPDICQQARQALAAFVGAEPEQLGFVANATMGLQAAAMAVPLKPGQRVITTNHTYPALTNLLRYLCDLRGTTLDIIELPASPQAGTQLLTALESQLDHTVGLVAIDHITSPTALLFPIEAVASLCRQVGVPILIDGAHGPGHVPLNLTTLGADWYVGNGHKWLGAPRGTAFLWCHDKWQDRTQTPAISHGYGRGFAENYTYYGTGDFSAWASLPHVIAWYKRLEDAGHFTTARHILRDQATAIADALDGQSVSAPDAPGLMTAILLPPSYTQAMREPLRQALRTHHNIVSVFTSWGKDRLMARLSSYVYNEAKDFTAYQTAMMSLKRSPPA